MEVIDSKGVRYLIKGLGQILIGNEDFLKDLYKPWIFNGLKSLSPKWIEHSIHIKYNDAHIFIIWSSINQWYYYYEAIVI